MLSTCQNMKGATKALKGLPGEVSGDNADNAEHSDEENNDHDEAFSQPSVESQTEEIIFMFGLSKRHLYRKKLTSLIPMNSKNLTKPS